MKNVKTGIVMAALLLGGIAFADSATDAEFEKMAKSRISGVTRPKKNPDGSIKSLLIIGRASINRLLDADRAEEDARENAGINASELFTEYLNKNATFSRIRQSGTAASSSAAEKNGETSQSEDVKTINVRSKEFASLSQAAIAGMKEIYAGVFNNKYVIIYAWDKEECKQLNDVILTMSETAQTAIKEAKDAESRLTAPAGSYQAPVERRSEPARSRRDSSTVTEGGSASSDAGKYL